MGDHPDRLAAARVLAVFVAGRPAPQGSKRARPIYSGSGETRQFTGKVAQVEVSQGVKTWRQDVRAACLDETGRPRARVDGAVAVRLDFVMPRPKHLAKKPTPPATKQPDLDKLERSTLDALTSAGVFGDDAHVVDIHATKRIAEPGETPGCEIHAWPAAIRLDDLWLELDTRAERTADAATGLEGR